MGSEGEGKEAVRRQEGQGEGRWMRVARRRSMVLRARKREAVEAVRAEGNGKGKDSLAPTAREVGGFSLRPVV